MTEALLKLVQILERIARILEARTNVIDQSDRRTGEIAYSAKCPPGYVDSVIYRHGPMTGISPFLLPPGQSFFANRGETFLLIRRTPVGK